MREPGTKGLGTRPTSHSLSVVDLRLEFQVWIQSSPKPLGRQKRVCYTGEIWASKARRPVPLPDWLCILWRQKISLHWVYLLINQTKAHFPSSATLCYGSLMAFCNFPKAREGSRSISRLRLCPCMMGPFPTSVQLLFYELVRWLRVKRGLSPPPLSPPRGETSQESLKTTSILSSQFDCKNHSGLRYYSWI